MSVCPLCERSGEDLVLTRHHLRTRSVDEEEIERICAECHRALHALFGRRDLRRGPLGTLEGLKADERMAAAIAHVRKIPPGRTLTVRLSNRLR